jgi:Protein of unknown function (DUF2628)
MTDFANTRLSGLYEDAIGQKNQSYYLEKFEDFDNQGPGLSLSWNWAAFLFTGFWALYRKMYGWCFSWWAVGVVLTVFSKAQNSHINQVLGTVVGVLWIGFSLYANSIYHHKVKKRIASAQQSNSDAARISRRLSAGGGIHAWIPIVLGVVPVVGIVVAVALPAYEDYVKRKSPVAVMPWEERYQGQSQTNEKRSQIDEFLSGAQTSRSTDTPTQQNAPMPTLDLSEFQTPPAKQPATPQNPFEATQAIADTVAPKAPSAEEQEHLRLIYAAHSNADEIYNSPGFKAWVAKYPAYQRILSKGSTQEIIEMFTAYKNQR